MVQLHDLRLSPSEQLSYLVPKRKRRLQQQLAELGQHQPYSSFCYMCYTPVWIINNTDLASSNAARVQRRKLLENFRFLIDWHIFHPYLCLRRIMRIKL